MPDEGFQVPSHVTIPAGGTTSNPLLVRGPAQCGFILPATFQGSSISFLVAVGDKDATVDATTLTYGAFYDSSNNLVTITVTQGRAYAFPINLFPFAWVKLVSNSTEDAARTILIAEKY